MQRNPYRVVVLVALGISVLSTSNVHAQQCDLYQQIREEAAPGGFVKLAGEALDQGASVASVKLSGATECTVHKAGAKGLDGSLAQYSCSWRIAKIPREKALKEGYDLGNGIARCFGAEKTTTKKGNDQVFTVYPDGKPVAGKSVLVFRVVTSTGQGGARHELSAKLFEQ